MLEVGNNRNDFPSQHKDLTSFKVNLLVHEDETSSAGLHRTSLEHCAPGAKQVPPVWGPLFEQYVYLLLQDSAKDKHEIHFIIFQKICRIQFFSWRFEHDVTYHSQTLIGCPDQA